MSLFCTSNIIFQEVTIFLQVTAVRLSGKCFTWDIFGKMPAFSFRPSDSSRHFFIFSGKCQRPNTSNLNKLLRHDFLWISPNNFDIKMTDVLPCFFLRQHTRRQPWCRTPTPSWSCTCRRRCWGSRCKHSASTFMISPPGMISKTIVLTWYGSVLAYFWVFFSMHLLRLEYQVPRFQNLHVTKTNVSPDSSLQELCCQLARVGGRQEHARGHPEPNYPPPRRRRRPLPGLLVGWFYISR